MLGLEIAILNPKLDHEDRGATKLAQVIVSALTRERH
jgi:hypothetical protein